MADTKLSALTLAAAAAGDHIYILDDPGGTPLDRKATVQSILDLAPVQSVAALTGSVSAAALRTALNVADGATANATDAQLRDRATHTGAQAIGTVTGLQTALDGKARGTFLSATPPTVNSDSNAGFAADDFMRVTAGAETNNIYRCKDATVGAAVWNLVFDDASVVSAADQAALADADKVLAFANGDGASPILIPGSFFARRNIEINAQTGTAYALLAADAGKLVTMNNAGANAVNIALNAVTAYPDGMIFNVAQIGAGVTSVTVAAGATLNGVDGGSVALSGAWKQAGVARLGTDNWIIGGDLA